MTNSEILLSCLSASLILVIGPAILLFCRWRNNRRPGVVILPPEQYTGLPLTNPAPERTTTDDTQGLRADR